MNICQRITIDGTSDLQLDTSDMGFAIFLSAVGVGVSCPYSVVSQDRTQFEHGTSTLAPGGVAARTPVTSSNANALVEFGPGSHIVNIDAPAAGGGDRWPIVYKTEHTERDDDTLADDPDLQFPVTRGIYAINGYIALQMTDTEGFKFTFSGPAASRVSLAHTTATDIELRDALDDPMFLPAAPDLTMIMVQGTVTFEDPGTMAFQWGQETDVPDAITSVFRGSWVEYLRMGDIPA